jgi:Domain of unknown function (DUF397)
VARLGLWRKSSYSSGDGQCVEVADLDVTIAIRDSKNANSPKLPGMDNVHP